MFYKVSLELGTQSQSHVDLGSAALQVSTAPLVLPGMWCGHLRVLALVAVALGAVVRGAPSGDVKVEPSTPKAQNPKPSNPQTQNP